MVITALVIIKNKNYIYVFSEQFLSGKNSSLHEQFINYITKAFGYILICFTNSIVKKKKKNESSKY